MTADTPTASVSVAQTLPRTSTCSATTGRVAAAFGFTPVICSQSVGVKTFITTTGLRVGYCSIEGHEASVRRQFRERPVIAPTRRLRVLGCATCASEPIDALAPPHDASPRCESGRRDHCTCDGCF